jgi:hypothetical protein
MLPSVFLLLVDDPSIYRRSTIPHGLFWTVVTQVHGMHCRLISELGFK